MCVFVLGNDAAPVCVNLSMTAETKISSLKRLRQPFGWCDVRRVCIMYVAEHVCGLIMMFLCRRIEECAAAYWEEINLHAGIFVL